MAYEVDQSNKIEQRGDTALALSNDKTYTIRIPDSEKRAAIDCLNSLKRGRRKLTSLRLFAVTLYYLLQELPPGEVVMIDEEYTGHMRDIVSMVLNLMRRDDPHFDESRLRVGYVGKKSRAHEEALAVFRGEAQANRILKADVTAQPGSTG